MLSSFINNQETLADIGPRISALVWYLIDMSPSVQYELVSSAVFWLQSPWTLVAIGLVTLFCQSRWLVA